MPVTRPLDSILAAVDKMGSARLEIDEEAANVRVGARVLARIDLHRDELLVNAPSDVLPALQNAFPSLAGQPPGWCSTSPIRETSPMR
jgi:hypothetical protein